MYRLWWFITSYVIACSATRDYFDTSSFTPESELEYVDPNSLYYDKHMKEDLPPTIGIGLYLDGDNSDDIQCRPCIADLQRCRMALRNRPVNTDIAEESFSKRLVNMLLSRGIFVNKGNVFIGSVELQATELELVALRNFGKGKLTFREADTIFSKILKPPHRNSIHDTWMWMESMTYSAYSILYYSIKFVSEYKYMIVGPIITLWLVLRLRQMRYKFRHIFIFSIVTIFVVSFFLTWWKLVQAAEIEHSTLQMKHMKMPIHCQPSKMNWWDKITTLLASQDDCQKYHEAVMKTPFLQVTPAQALSHMLSYVIHEPIALAGKTLAIFMQNLTGEMSWFTGFIAKILMCAIFPMLLIICVIMIFGGSMHIGAFGLLKSFFAKDSKESKTNGNNTVTGNTDRRPIEIFLNVLAQPPLPTTPAIAAVSLDNPDESVSNDKPKKSDKIRKRKVKKEILSSIVTNETNVDASGDFEVIHKPSDSDTDSSEIVLKNVVPKSRHVGSGDSAS